MKKLLAYYLKKRLHIVLILSAIMVTILTVFISNINFIHNAPVWDQTYEHIIGYEPVAVNSPIGYLTVFSCLLATIVPLFEFYFKMKKISIDQQYSLPIKREKLFLTKYIVGLFIILASLTIAYIWMIFITSLKENIFNMGYIYLYYPVLIGLTSVLYTIICFVYTRANTFFDGLINILFYIFIFVILLGILNAWNLKVGENWSWFFIYSPHTCADRIFIKLSENDPSSYKTIDLISMLFFTIVAIIFFILFIILNKIDKSENSMQISESYFSYKVMIPLYTILCSGLVVHSEGIILAFIFTGSYIMYATYKRTFKLSKKDISILIIILVVSIIFAIISNEISFTNNTIPPVIVK